MKKVLFLTRYDRLGASSRLRSLQYLPYISAQGIQCQVEPLLDNAYLEAFYNKKKISLAYLLKRYFRRVLILLTSRNFDLVFIEKEIFPNLPSWFERLLAWMKVPYIADYDDAVFHNYDRSKHPFKRLLKNKIRSVMRNASLVTVGNTYLARHATDIGMSHVALLPTVIDIRRYPLPRQRATSERLVVGWIGSPSTVKFLRPLLPVLAEVAEIYELELVVIGAEVDASDFDYGFVRSIAWREDTEVEEISRFDIGVMPLPDEPWERGKCGYKLIQYMACGKPVVASPVGVNADIVQDGLNGYLATTSTEWFNALCRLMSDAELRKSMGSKGRALVEEKYCLQVTAPKLLQLLRQVVSEKKSSVCVN